MELSPSKRRKRTTATAVDTNAMDGAAAASSVSSHVHPVTAIPIGPAPAVASSSATTRPHARKRPAASRLLRTVTAEPAAAVGSAAGMGHEGQEAAEARRVDDDEEMDDAETESDAGQTAIASAAATPAAATAAGSTSASSAAIRCLSFPRGFAERALYTPLDAHIFFSSTPSEFEQSVRAVLDLDDSYALPTRMTRAEWAVVRRAMGPTRRLSRAFLRDQRLWLQHQRAVMRAQQKEAFTLQSSNSNMRAIDAATAPLLHSLPVANGSSAPPILPAGAAVFALHPSESGLAPAVVLDAIEAQESSDAYCSTQRQRTPSSRRNSVTATSPAAVPAAAAPLLHAAPAATSAKSSVGATRLHLVYRVRFDDAPHAPPSYVTDAQLFLRPHHSSEQTSLLQGRHAHVLDPPRDRDAGTEARHTQMLGGWDVAPATAPTAAPTAAATATTSSASSIPAPFMHSPSDVRLLCELLQLVDRKKLLVEQLKLMNEATDIMRAYPTAAEENDDGMTATATASVSAAAAATASPPAGPALPVDVVPTLQQVDSTLLPMQIDGDEAPMPALERLAGGAHPAPAPAPAAPYVAVPPATAPHSSSPSDLDPPDPDLTVPEFSVAYDQFVRQYAWVVLQLEGTSRALDTAMQQLRVRRAAARRQEAARIAGPNGPFSTLGGSGAKQEADAGAVVHQEASRMVQARVREMLMSGSLARSCSLASRDSDVQRLVSHAIAIVIMLQRVMEGRDSPAWLEAAGASLLASLAPKHAQHAHLHAAIVESMRSLQRTLAEPSSAPSSGAAAAP